MYFGRHVLFYFRSYKFKYVRTCITWLNFSLFEQENLCDHISLKPVEQPERICFRRRVNYVIFDLKLLNLHKQCMYARVCPVRVCDAGFVSVSR